MPNSLAALKLILFKFIINNKVLTIKVKNILYIFNINSNLLSTNIIYDKEHTIVIKNNEVKIHKKRRLIAISIQESNNLFRLNIDYRHSYTHLAKSISKTENLKLWYYKLGHLGINNIKVI